MGKEEEERGKAKEREKEGGKAKEEEKERVEEEEREEGEERVEGEEKVEEEVEEEEEEEVEEEAVALTQPYKINVSMNIRFSIFCTNCVSYIFQWFTYMIIKGYPIHQSIHDDLCIFMIYN